MFITCTEYPLNTKNVKANIGVTSFASGYGSGRLICQLRDGKTETLILQEVVHLPGSFNLISQSQMMDKDFNVEPVNHYGLNLYNRHGKLIVTAPQVDGQCVLDCVLDRVLGSTEYTNIDNDSCLLALKTTGHPSCHDAKKRMLWHHRMAHVGLKALEILPMINDAPKMTGQCDYESCIKCKLDRKPFTPMTSRDPEPLQLVHSDICGPLETAIRGGHYMLLFIHDATSNVDEYILMYKLEPLEKFKQWKALREKESGKQVKRFCPYGDIEYTPMNFEECLKSEGIIKEMTTPSSPQFNGVFERANRTKMEFIRCMLDDAGLPTKYWSFAVSVEFYLKNRTPTRLIVRKTPYEACHGAGKTPSLKHLCVFGCLAFV
jgi:hypothetical protein